MVAHKVVHVMKNKRKDNNGFVVAKLNMSKAYDRIEWPYLKEVMRALGLSSDWVLKIMNCVTTASYSLVLNGEQTATSIRSWDIRHGDPLSPYLFIMCTKGLYRFLWEVKRNKKVSGLRVTR